MAQFSIKDLADLARAGYTPATVKELLTLERAEPTTEKPPAGTGADDEPQPAAGDPIQEPEKESDRENAQESVNVKIETLKQQLEEAQNALKAAQDANIRKDVSGDSGDPEKSLKDIFASYA